MKSCIMWNAIIIILIYNMGSQGRELGEGHLWKGKFRSRSKECSLVSQKPGQEESPAVNFKLPEPVNFIQEQSWDWAWGLCLSLLQCRVCQINERIHNYFHAESFLWTIYQIKLYTELCHVWSKWLSFRVNGHGSVSHSSMLGSVD